MKNCQYFLSHNRIYNSKLAQFQILVTAIVFLLLTNITAESFVWKNAHEKEYSMSTEEILNLNTEENDENLYIKALSMLSQRQDKKAEELFLIMQERIGVTVESRWGLAEIYRRRYLKEKSKGILEDIMKDNPQFIPAKISRAYMYFEEDIYKKAIDLAEDVLKSAPDSVDKANIIRAHLIIGGARGMLAKKSFILTKVTRGLSALGHLKDAKNINPEDPGVVFAWGSYYLEAPGIAGGDMEKAEEYLLLALQKNPGFADVHVRLAQLYLKKGDTEAYNEHIRKAKLLDPRNKLLNSVLKENK